MKSDKEFLEGVYAKVQKMRLEDISEDPVSPLKTSGEKPRRFSRPAWMGAAAAAALAVICVPLILWAAPEPMEPAPQPPEPATYGLGGEKAQPRIRTAPPYQDLFQRADTVVKLESRGGAVEISRIWKQGEPLADPAWTADGLAALLPAGIPEGDGVILFLAQADGVPSLLDAYQEQKPDGSSGSVSLYHSASGDVCSTSDLDMMSSSQAEDKPYIQ